MTSNTSPDGKKTNENVIYILLRHNKSLTTVLYAWLKAIESGGRRPHSRLWQPFLIPLTHLGALSLSATRAAEHEISFFFFFELTSRCSRCCCCCFCWSGLDYQSETYKNKIVVCVFDVEQAEHVHLDVLCGSPRSTRWERVHLFKTTSPENISLF